MAELPQSLRRRPPSITPAHQPPAPKLSEQVWRWVGRVMTLLLLAGLLLGAVRLYQQAIRQQISQVVIDGVSPLEQQYLVQFLAPVTQGNYYSLDLGMVRDRALQLNWIDRVVVSRAWPDRVVVRVTPRVAAARWGTGRYLSDDGVVFQPLRPFTSANLPLLHGPLTQTHVMMNRYHDIDRLFSPLHLQLKELYLTDRMTWFMQFDHGVRVIVDQNQTMSKLQRLQTLVQGELRPIWPLVAAVDLRYRNGLALQWRQGVAPPISHGQFVPQPPASASP